MQYMDDICVVEYIISCLSPVGRSASSHLFRVGWENGREHGTGQINANCVINCTKCRADIANCVIDCRKCKNAGQISANCVINCQKSRAINANCVINCTKCKNAGHLNANYVMNCQKCRLDK